MMLAVANTEATSDIGCKKGVWWGLKRGCSPAIGKEKAGGEAVEEGRGAVVEEEVCTAGEEYWTAGVAEEEEVLS